VPKTRKPRRLGTGRKARRAGGGSAKRTFRFQRPQVADAKYSRLKRPVLEDAPPPVAARQLLLRRGLLGDQVHVTRELIYLRLRRRCSGAANDGARCRGDGGLDGFDVVVLRRGRRRSAELRERAAPRGSRSGADSHDRSSRLA
jgi:hypothetical protein